MTRLLTAEEVAELLAVPKTWVYAQARQDRIPHVRLGHYVRFDRDAIGTWWKDMQRGGKGLSA